MLSNLGNFNRWTVRYWDARRHIWIDWSTPMKDADMAMYYCNLMNGYVHNDSTAYFPAGKYEVIGSYVDED